MAAKKKAKSLRERPVSTKPGPTFQTYYSNTVGLQVTPWDIKMIFGRINRADQEALDIEEICAVYMSPEHAVAFLKALGLHVAQYTAKHGHIREFEDGLPKMFSPAPSAQPQPSSQSPSGEKK